MRRLNSRAKVGFARTSLPTLAVRIGNACNVCIKLTDIRQEFIDEYDLTKYVQHGWIHFAIIRSAYGLKQSRKLFNNLLRTRV